MTNLKHVSILVLVTDAIIIVVYGASKSGKTVDALYSFPNAAFMVPYKGGTSPWRCFTGIKPNVEVVQTLDDATAYLKRIPKGGQHYVVMDDFTILAEQTQLKIQGMGRMDKQKWGKILDKMLRFRATAIERGISVILTCHEREPHNGDDGFTQGLPKMPSLNMSKAIPHIASTVLHTGSDMQIQGLLSNWQGAYLCDPAARSWLTGDRLNVVNGRVPMNLREILVQAKAIGWDVAIPQRAPSVAWIDPVVEKLAAALGSGTPPAGVAAELARVFPSMNPSHLAWAHRDGFARHHLRNMNLFAQYTLNPTAPASTPVSPAGQ